MTTEHTVPERCHDGAADLNAPNPRAIVFLDEIEQHLEKRFAGRGDDSRVNTQMAEYLLTSIQSPGALGRVVHIRNTQTRFRNAFEVCRRSVGISLRALRNLAKRRYHLSRK